MIFTKPKIAALLELMDDVVNGDDTVPWAAKRDAIKAVAKEFKHETALEEFIAWFEVPEEA